MDIWSIRENKNWLRLIGREYIDIMDNLPKDLQNIIREYLDESKWRAINREIKGIRTFYYIRDGVNYSIIFHPVFWNKYCSVPSSFFANSSINGKNEWTRYSLYNELMRGLKSLAISGNTGYYQILVGEAVEILKRMAFGQGYYFVDGV